jgi:hypothetical protein
MINKCFFNQNGESFQSGGPIGGERVTNFWKKKIGTYSIFHKFLVFSMMRLGLVWLCKKNELR